MERKLMRGAVLFVALGLILSQVGAVPAVKATESSIGGRLQVSGVGTIEVTPDQAVILFRLAALRNSAGEAQAANAESLKALQAALGELGLSEEDIRTRSVNLREEWEYRTDERVFKGYRSEHVLAVTLSDLDQVGTVMDSVVKRSGATIDGVEFGLRDRREAERLALAQAYEHAASRAQVLADMAGVTLGAPRVILDQSSVVAAMPVRMEQAQLRAVAFDASTPVFAGTIQVDARVQLEFGY